MCSVSTRGNSNASRNQPVRSAVQTSGGRSTGPPSAPRATTAAAASASEGPPIYCGRGATSSIVPTHVFRPRTGAQGAQRDAGGRVRIDDGGSNDLWLLRRPPSSTTTPATQSAWPCHPSTSRDTSTVSGSFSVPERRFFRRRENAAVARSFWPDRRAWSCRRARGPLERRKRLPWRRVSVGFGWISSRDRTNVIRSRQHPHGWA